MRELKTEIEILCKPDKVWETIKDLSNWSNWNPVVNKMEGKFEVGAELSITMSDSKGNDGKKYKSIITEIDEKKGFTFIATMMAKFMFSAERIIELKETQNGTLFIQKENYTGFMVSLFWGKLSTEALEMLNSMNKALKKEVEK